MSDLQEVLKQVEQLDKKSRKSVFDSLLRQFEAPIDANLSAAEHDFYEVLTRVLGPIQSLPDLIGSVKARKYKDRAEMLFATIGSGCAEPLARRERIALAAECLDCLVDWIDGLRDSGHSSARSAINLINHMSNLSTAIDRNYPGYIEARMLHRLVQLQAA